MKGINLEQNERLCYQDRKLNFSAMILSYQHIRILTPLVEKIIISKWLKLRLIVNLKIQSSNFPVVVQRN